MYPKKVAQETAKVVQSYLTYQAVRTILDQLGQTNPQKAIWLQNFSANNRVQDGERYLEEMMAEDKEMVLRILTVREHLAEAALDFMPEMVRSNIQKANVDRRRQVLERLTQTIDRVSDPPDFSHPELDSDNSSDA